MSSLPTLGYWDIRGLAEPIRYLLRYAGVAFNDKRYPIGPTWFEEKFTLGLDFPNIPYYMDDDMKLTQSLTILRYLARKHGLIARDDPTLARQELVEQQLNDIREKMFGVVVEDDYAAKRPKYAAETLVPQLEQLIKFLGNNEWLTKQFSYVDILAYETLDWLRLFTPDTIAKFPILEQYMTRFENLPKIKEYRESTAYKSWPLFGPIVKWGYKKE